MAYFLRHDCLIYTYIQLHSTNFEAHYIYIFFASRMFIWIKISPSNFSLCVNTWGMAKMKFKNICINNISSSLIYRLQALAKQQSKIGFVGLKKRRLNSSHAQKKFSALFSTRVMNMPSAVDLPKKIIWMRRCVCVFVRFPF